jgi:hypothetical protein
MPNDTFAPFQSLFAQLAPAFEASDDGSHDASHLERVWRNTQLLAAQEGGDLKLLAAAVILHDCVEVSKDSPLRAQASQLSAAKAGSLLEGSNGTLFRSASSQTPSSRTAIPQTCRPRQSRAASCRMPIGSTQSAWWASHAASIQPAACGRNYIARLTPVAKTTPSMIAAMRSIISR